MDTKGTKEIIKALNPGSEIRAIDKKEEEFIERAQLRRDSKRDSVFRSGIDYLKRRGAQGLRGTRKAIGSFFQKPLPKTRRIPRANIPNITNKVKRPMENVPFEYYGAEGRLAAPGSYNNPIKLNKNRLKRSIENISFEDDKVKTPMENAPFEYYGAEGRLAAPGSYNNPMRQLYNSTRKKSPKENTPFEYYGAEERLAAPGSYNNPIKLNKNRLKRSIENISFENDKIKPPMKNVPYEFFEAEGRLDEPKSYSNPMWTRS